MNNHTLPPTEDPKGTIAWHLENIRFGLLAIEKANLTEHPKHISGHIGPLIHKLHCIDALTLQLIGQASKRKDEPSCSLPLANSPSSQSLPPSSQASS